MIEQASDDDDIEDLDEDNQGVLPRRRGRRQIRDSDYNEGNENDDSDSDAPLDELEPENIYDA